MRAEARMGIAVRPPVPSRQVFTPTRPLDGVTQQHLYQATVTKGPPDPRRINGAIPRNLDVVPGAPWRTIWIAAPAAPSARG